jgi:hypothetical protein
MVATVLKVHVFNGSGSIMIVRRGLSSRVIQARKESRNRPSVAQRVPGGLGSQIS